MTWQDLVLISFRKLCGEIRVKLTTVWDCSNTLLTKMCPRKTVGAQTLHNLMEKSPRPVVGTYGPSLPPCSEKVEGARAQAPSSP